jgi:hypothetical protein
MFNFTIRDVLWLTALTVLAAAWFCDHGALTWNRRVSDAKLHLAGEKLNELGWTTKTYSNGREFALERVYRPEPKP